MLNGAGQHHQQHSDSGTKGSPEAGAIPVQKRAVRDHEAFLPLRLPGSRVDDRLPHLLEGAAGAIPSEAFPPGPDVLRVHIRHYSSSQIYLPHFGQ